LWQYCGTRFALLVHQPQYKRKKKLRRFKNERYCKQDNRCFDGVYCFGIRYLCICRQKLDEQREAFFKSTQDLRQNIYQKQLALESEFAKKNPDVKIAKNLQKEISDLRAQIDQKQIEHMIEMKKINPAIGSGFMGPGMMGHGYGRGYKGHGPMMGYGTSFDRPCWQ
jgi:hypothetical protein